MKNVRTFSVESGRATHLFLLFVLPVYCAYALLTPPFQSPDEQQHLFRAYQLSLFHVIGVRKGDQAGGLLPASLTQAAFRELGTSNIHAPKKQPKTSFSERFGQRTPLAADETRRFTNFAGAAPYAPIGYVAQIAAIWVGRLIELPVEWMVRLGRVFNGILTASLFFAAFRFLPFGHRVLIFFALFPMTGACAGSFGQDGLIISASAWLTAISLRVIIQRQWRRYQVMIVAALSCGITLAKFVYLPLAALPLIPVPNKSSFFRWVAPPAAITVSAAALAVAWIRSTSRVLMPASPGLTAPTSQLSFVAHHPIAFMQVLGHTYSLHEMKRIIGTMFSFGWLNVGPVWPAAVLTTVAALATLWSGDRRSRLLSNTWRFWAMVISASIVLLISAAIYSSYNALAARMIEGLQGRYFIPVLFPIFLAVLPRRDAKSLWVDALIIISLLGANCAALFSIAKTYYG